MEDFISFVGSHQCSVDDQMSGICKSPFDQYLSASVNNFINGITQYTDQLVSNIMLTISNFSLVILCIICLFVILYLLFRYRKSQHIENVKSHNIKIIRSDVIDELMNDENVEIYIHKNADFDKVNKNRYRNISDYSSSIKNPSGRRDKTFNLVCKRIHEYPTPKKFSNERSYHSSLHGWMLERFPHIKYESATDDSRPDLTLGHRYIAIEVKGPTTKVDLDSVLNEKCIKYPRVYKHVIIVLFHVDKNINGDVWESFLSIMKNDYPYVKLIIKE